jgi:hypothetical protein
MRAATFACLVTTFSVLGCGARTTLPGEAAAEGSGGGGGGIGGITPPPGCDNTTEPIYLLTTPESPGPLGSLHVLDPVSKQITLFGTLVCPLPTASSLGILPNTMTMARDGTLWVSAVEPASEQFDGYVYKVNPADLSCTLTDITILQDWSQLMMGFVYEGEKETLYVHGVDGGVTGEGQGLGRIDFETNTLVPIGPLGAPLTDAFCELTGIGNERLFAFCRTAPMQLAELEPSTAEVLTIKGFPEIDGPLPSGWAMTFWGGDFYLFTANIAAVRASRFRPKDGSFEVDYIPEMPFVTIGAATHPCPKGS